MCVEAKREGGREGMSGWFSQAAVGNVMIVQLKVKSDRKVAVIWNLGGKLEAMSECFS